MRWMSVNLLRRQEKKFLIASSEKEKKQRDLHHRTQESVASVVSGTMRNSEAKRTKLIGN